MSGLNSRRWFAAVSGSTRFTWVATGLAAIAFVALHQLHTLGTVRLWILLPLLVLAAGHTDIASRQWRKRPSAYRMHWVIAAQTTGTAGIIYAIGFGPTLAIGFVFVLAEDFEHFGKDAETPALLWMVGSLAIGQLAIAVNLVPASVSCSKPTRGRCSCMTTTPSGSWKSTRRRSAGTATPATSS